MKWEDGRNRAETEAVRSVCQGQLLVLVALQIACPFPSLNLPTQIWSCTSKIVGTDPSRPIRATEACHRTRRLLGGCTTCWHRCTGWSGVMLYWSVILALLAIILDCKVINKLIFPVDPKNTTAYFEENLYMDFYSRHMPFIQHKKLLWNIKNQRAASKTWISFIWTLQFPSDMSLLFYYILTLGVHVWSQFIRNQDITFMNQESKE